MDKKGIITIQFNWIYVIIVGGLIIALFIGIVIKQKSVSDIAASGEMQRKLETLLVSAASSPGTTNFVDIGRTEINVDCFGYVVGSLEPFDPGASFSPSRINVKGKQFITWTLPFNAPYRITNFLYVTSKQVRYIIVGDPNDYMFKEMNSTLPEQLKVEFVDGSLWLGVRYKNEYKTRIVFIETLKSPLDSSFRKADVTALLVSGDTIKFYEKKLNTIQWEFKDESSYRGLMPILYGAIFADEFETFECNIAKAEDRSDIIKQIYIDRTNKLSAALEYPHCSSYYGTAIAAFGTGNSYDLNTANVNLQIHSCPLLY